MAAASSCIYSKEAFVVDDCVFGQLKNAALSLMPALLIWLVGEELFKRDIPSVFSNEALLAG